MLSQNVLSEIQEVLSLFFNQDVEINNTHSVSGGDINDAYRLETSQGYFFVKTNFANRFPRMFEMEAIGLGMLRSVGVFTVPQVIALSEENDISYLLLEWIESAQPETDFWENFGKQLAQLHQNSSDQFGLVENNYIGSLSQSNQQHKTWVEFFIHERLQVQIKMAVDAGKMDSQTIAQFENLYKELPNIFPEEPPALLHGDLWSGNYMVGNNGEPVIMDPAVYYGHREMDLAMTKLFGGFGNEMYQSYNEHYSLQQGWESRIAICNLYPLLVHINLFGGGYLQQIKSIINQF